MTSSDTHDNGREEQWEKTMPYGPKWDGVVDIRDDLVLVARCRTEAIADAILAAHAQAGLAQEMRDELFTARYFLGNSPSHDPPQSKLDWEWIERATKLIARYDATLTAGPTAEETK